LAEVTKSEWDSVLFPTIEDLETKRWAEKIMAQYSSWNIFKKEKS